MRSSRRLLWCCALASLVIVSASCGPRYIDGFAFVQPNAATSRLFVARGAAIEVIDGHAMLPPDTTVRLGLDRAIAVDADQDIVVAASGVGTLAIAAYAPGSSDKPLAHGAFQLVAGMRAELHLIVPAGATVGFIEFQPAGIAAMRVDSLGTGPLFRGIALSDGLFRQDSATAPRFDAGRLTAVSLAGPIDPGASVVVALAQDGVVRVTGQSCPTGSGAASGFEAGIRRNAPLAIPRQSIDSTSGAIGALVESEAGLASVRLEPGLGAPLADLYAFLAAPAPVGDYSLYRWDLLPETLVIDFKDYATQDDYLKRLAFFAEKPGFRGRLATDAEIAPLHGWNAHDYSPQTLAAFYEGARSSGFALNQRELAFRDVLVARGVLTRADDGRFGAGRGAIVSISRESSAALRRTFIDHESSHALFFQDADYRSLAEGLWSSLDPASLGFWKIHFGWRRYDTQDRYLMYNEMQAYLVQQPVSSVKAYYESVLAQLVAAKLDQNRPGITATLQADAPAAIALAEKNAARLDAYLRERYGISAGRFGRTHHLGSR